MTSEHTPKPDRDDELPRRSFWSAVPRRSLSRVLLLLAMLAGILYLRARTGSIASCMSDSFRAPPPSPPGTRVHWPASPSLDADGKRAP